jgi:hypothetical protein
MARGPCSGVDYKGKRAMIGGVISFNDANGVHYSKIKLFKHFGIDVTTGYRWFPIASGAKSGPRQKVENITNGQGLKRTRSEDQDDEISALKAEPDEPTTPPRQNPIRNGGRDRKKLKAIVKGMTEQASVASTPPPPISPPSTDGVSSPAPSRQHLTPPKGKRGRPKKGLDAQSGQRGRRAENVMDLKHEQVDDDIYGAV